MTLTLLKITGQLFSRIIFSLGFPNVFSFLGSRFASLSRPSQKQCFWWHPVYEIDTQFPFAPILKSAGFLHCTVALFSFVGNKHFLRKVFWKYINTSFLIKLLIYSLFTLMFFILFCSLLLTVSLITFSEYPWFGQWESIQAWVLIIL